MNNQIIQTKKKETKKIRILQIQIIFSILGIITTLIFFKSLQNNSLNYTNYSKIISQNSKLNSMYEVEKTSNTSNIFGTLEIPAINLSYAVFNECNEELLKISPCKFYGVGIGEIR